MAHSIPRKAAGSREENMSTNSTASETGSGRGAQQPTPPNEERWALSVSAYGAGVTVGLIDKETPKTIIVRVLWRDSLARYPSRWKLSDVARVVPSRAEAWAVKVRAEAAWAAHTDALRKARDAVNDVLAAQRAARDAALHGDGAGGAPRPLAEADDGHRMNPK